MNGRDLGLLFGGFAVGLVTGLMFKKKEEPTKEEPDAAFEDKVSDASVELSQHYANMARNTHMASSLMHDIEEKMKKEPDVEFKVKDSDTPVKVTNYAADVIRNTYWINLISEIKEKIAKETEDGNKPYSKENSPSPMTKEQMRAYTYLKKMTSYSLLSAGEACALQELDEYEELLNKYSKEK